MQNSGADSRHAEAPKTFSRLPADLRSGVRVITTKNQTYSLPLSVPGIPIEDHLPGVELPAQLRGARIYPTEDGEVLALPIPQKHGRARRRQPAPE
jgi:hypothetical protein